MSRAESHRNLWLITWCLAGGLVVVAWRLAYIQLINPQEPVPFSSNDPEIKRIRPARRGEIRAADGTVLVQSQLAVVIRADPVRLSPFATDVARLAAAYLQMPEEDLLDRFQPVYVPYTQELLVTNAGVVSTNRQPVRRLVRSNLVATNVTPETWDHLVAVLQTNRFDVERRYASLRSNVVEQAQAALQATPWWDVPTRWKISRRRSADLKTLTRAWYPVRTNLLECRASGLYAEYIERRRYPLDHLAAHILGFTTNRTDEGPRRANLPVPLGGAQGIEQRFDQALRGKPGILQGRMVAGREYVPLRERDLPAVDGLNVMLTLNVEIQEAVERALDAAVERLNPRAISAIVVEPATGNVLALANRPTFDPNNRNRLLHPGMTNRMAFFKNRAINEPFEPGSTFKILTYAAVLNERLASLGEIIDCHGGRWTVPGTRRVIRDDQGHYLNRVTLEEAFAKSSNVGAVALGLRVPTNRFVQYIRDFGLLDRTEIECGEQELRSWVKQVTVAPGITNSVTNLVMAFGETAGTIPSWDGWTAQSLAFGYGLRITPLHTVMMAAAVANGGVLMKPRLVTALKTSDNQLVKEFPVLPGRRVIDATTADRLVTLMEKAVTEGTGRGAELADFEVAGKTGTAKKHMRGEGYTTAHYYGSFVGFFPARRPAVAIVVTVDEPTTAGKAYYGGKAAAPVFQQIAQDVANVLKLAPTVVPIHSSAAVRTGLAPAAQFAQRP